jgi:hypothetical protein
MENTTLTTKVVFILTTSEFPTPQIIDVMDVDVAWNVSMVNYASRYAFENGHIAYGHVESNYGRTVTVEAESKANGRLQQWTITKSQPAHFNGNVELNDSSRKCFELVPKI